MKNYSQEIRSGVGKNFGGCRDPERWGRTERISHGTSAPPLLEKKRVQEEEKRNFNDLETTGKKDIQMVD